MPSEGDSMEAESSGNSRDRGKLQEFEDQIGADERRCKRVGGKGMVGVN